MSKIQSLAHLKKGVPNNLQFNGGKIMKDLILKLKKEDGAAEIIEMTLIFPFVVVILGFLIYVGCYIFNCVTVYNDVQRVAVVASRVDAYPGYDQLYDLGKNELPNQVDFKSDVDLGVTKINDIMGVHAPYRNWGNYLDKSKTVNLDDALKTIISKQSLVSNSNISCNISETNNVISKTVTVNVKQQFTMPGFLKYIGVTEPTILDVTVQAASQDNSEFIRNTDLVADICNDVFNNLGFGKSGKTMSERVSVMKQKFNDARNKLGWK